MNKFFMLLLILMHSCSDGNKSKSNCISTCMTEKLLHLGYYFDEKDIISHNSIDNYVLNIDSIFEPLNIDIYHGEKIYTFNFHVYEIRFKSIEGYRILKIKYFINTKDEKIKCCLSDLLCATEDIDLSRRQICIPLNNTLIQISIDRGFTNHWDFLRDLEKDIINQYVNECMCN